MVLSEDRSIYYGRGCDAMSYFNSVGYRPSFPMNPADFLLDLGNGCTVVCMDGSEECFGRCIIAVHAPDALKILGDQVTHDEARVLGAFQYAYMYKILCSRDDIFLHQDKQFMPQNTSAWSAWNFLECPDNKVCVTYWLNILQNLGETDLPYLVTLNPPHVSEHTLLKWKTGHPVPSVAASKAALELFSDDEAFVFNQSFESLWIMDSASWELKEVVKGMTDHVLLCADHLVNPKPLQSIQVTSFIGEGSGARWLLQLPTKMVVSLVM